MQRTARILGIVCLALILLCLLPAFLFHCERPALILGGVSLLTGGLLGALMALITRTRRPTLIYVCILAGGLSFWPMYHNWPPLIWIYPDILAADGPIENVFRYLEALRPTLFLLGFPYPYVHWGQHGPDPVPADSNKNNLEENNRR